MSVARWNCHSWPQDVSSSVNCHSAFVWGSICQSMLIYQGISPLYLGESSSQSMSVCQVVCTGIQGISPLYLWGDPSGKEGLSARKSRFVCQVLCTQGGPLARIGLSAKFCVPREVHQPKKVHLPEKVGSSAKFCVPRGIHQPKKVCLPDLSSQMFRCGHHRGLFLLHMKDQLSCRGVSGVLGVLRGLHLTWIYNANSVFTNLIIQKYKEIPTFTWRIQHGCQIIP